MFIESVNDNIVKSVDEASDPWGIKVEKVEIKDIKIPENMERIIARVAEAEREKRAIIVKSQGEVEAAEKLAEAAKIIATSPGAMHLRTLATLSDLSGDKSNTLVFAVPVEILNSFKQTNIVETVKNVIKK